MDPTAYKKLHNRYEILALGRSSAYRKNRTLLAKTLFKIGFIGTLKFIFSVKVFNKYQSYFY